MPDKKPKFDVFEYNTKQLIEILTCPVNRHATRVEHNCDDCGLYQHPEWLFDRFKNNGGAEAFAKKRLEFQRLCDELENCHFAGECQLSLIHNGWMHCPIKTKKDKCMRCALVKEPDS